MSRSKKLLVLLAVLVLVCAATFGVTQYQEKQEQIKNSGETILEIPADTVTALSWEYGDTALAFHKDETWIYDEDEAFPVSEDAINTLLSQFESFSAAFTIEAVEDYDQYGLEDPVCTIELTAGEQSYTIKLGNYSNLDSQRYVDIGDGNVYLMVEDPLDTFGATLQDLIENDETPAFAEVSAIRFSGEESYTIEYTEDSTETYRSTDVYFADGNALDTSRVESYLDTVSSLSLTDYVTYNVTAEELAQYGLEDPELTIAVDYTAEDEDGETVSETFTLCVSRDPEELEQIENGDEPDTTTAYVRVGESQIVYEISSSTYTSLMAASYNDLRHREALPAELEDVTQIEVTLDGSTYTFTAQDEDSGQVWSYGEAELEDSSFSDALASLEIGAAEDFTDEAPTGKEEIRFTATLDRDDGATVEVILYRYDGSDCLAVVDGESVGLISRSNVVELIEAVNAIVLD